jgi:hypothetical protein
MEYYPKRLVENIHQIIFDLDSELGIAPDLEYRKQLIKTLYVLRDLELYISTRLFEYLKENRVERTTEYLCPLPWEYRN